MEKYATAFSDLFIDMWKALNRYNTTFALVDGAWCNRNRPYGCNNRDVYDLDYPERAHLKEEFCAKWSRHYFSVNLTSIYIYIYIYIYIIIIIAFYLSSI